MSDSTWSVINAMSHSHTWETTAAATRFTTHSAANRVCAACGDDFDAVIRYCPGLTTDTPPLPGLHADVPLPGLEDVR